jgi:hypothetical protein
VSHTVKAETSLEIEVAVTGTIIPAYAGDSTCPPNESGVEDLEAVNLWGLHRVAGGWCRTSLLDGVDRADPGVRKLLSNIEDFIREQASEALLAAEN